MSLPQLSNKSQLADIASKIENQMSKIQQKQKIVINKLRKVGEKKEIDEIRKKISAIN